MKFRGFLAAGSVIALCASGHAQTYDLREHYASNQVLVGSSLLEMEFRAVSSEPEGFEKMMTGAFRFTERSEVRVRILEAPDGFPSVQRYYIAAAETLDEEPDQPASRTTSPLVGKVVVARVSPGLDPTFEGDQGEAIDQEEAKKWCGDLPANLFEGVDVSSAQMGDEWDVPEASAKRSFHLSDRGTATVHARFAEVVEGEESRLARVELSLEVHDILGAKDAGQALTMQATGEYLFDLDRRLPHAMTLEGTVTSEADISESGLNVRITMAGPVRISKTIELP